MTMHTHAPLKTIAVLIAVLIWAPLPLGAESPPELSRQAIDKAIGMPEGTLLGHASEEQAQRLASLLCQYHALTMEALQGMEAANATSEIAQISNKLRTTTQRILGIIEETSKSQGSGEITLFFQSGQDRFSLQGPEGRRLVHFMDYLARENRGRTLFFISIGKASTPGSKEENLALSQRRANFPKAIIDHYLVNTPHAFYEISGVGEAAPTNGKTPVPHAQDRHTRLIAFYGKKSPVKKELLPLQKGAPMDKSATEKTTPEGPPSLPAVATNLGMEFAWIAPGTFTMGSPKSEPGRDADEVQNEVTLTRGFYMQTTEVTQAQWNALMETNPSYYKRCGVNCPVNRVSWTDAMVFIDRLNTTEQSGSYRLPTEAEWEYACRAGTTEAFANGPLIELECPDDENMDKMGWHNSNSGTRLHEVAQKMKNDWGLYDMHGNVWEWCRDREGGYGELPRTDPMGALEGRLRVIRGGSWSSDDRDCRSANRLFMKACDANAGVGFRLVLESEEAPLAMMPVASDVSKAMDLSPAYPDREPSF